MSAAASRRVVTGLNAAGKSCVIIDGAVPAMSDTGGLIWRSAAIPADNSGHADASGQTFSMELLHGGGSSFMVVDFAPGMPSFQHATDTLDYIVVLQGEVTLELEEGEVVCGPGSFIVDRGVKHSWRNDGNEVATIASIVVPAQPVGAGRTV